MGVVPRERGTSASVHVLGNWYAGTMMLAEIFMLPTDYNRGEHSRFRITRQHGQFPRWSGNATFSRFFPSFHSIISTFTGQLWVCFCDDRLPLRFPPCCLLSISMLTLRCFLLNRPSRLSNRRVLLHRFPNPHSRWNRREARVYRTALLPLNKHGRSPFFPVMKDYADYFDVLIYADRILS